MLRTYLRQRENRVAEAGACIQQMQKVLTDDERAVGQRDQRPEREDGDGDSEGDSHVGSAIRNAWRRSPTGVSRPAGKKSRKAWKGSGRKISSSCCGRCMICISFTSTSITDCDRQIEAQLKTLRGKVEVAGQPLPGAPRLPRRKHIPQTSLREELYRIAGVDLTRIDGLQVQTVQVVISEVGVDMTRWPDEHQFASWLGLCPNNRITGGKVIRRGTKKVLNRAAKALRLAAQTLHRSKSYLGAKYRRLRARLGGPVAITAMAHQLARLIYRLLRFGTEYHDKGMQHYERQYRETQMRWLKKQAAQLNMQLIPTQGVVN